MMQFLPSSIKAMKAGRKSQTRRLRKFHQSHNLSYAGIVASFEEIPQKVWDWNGSRLKWKVGNRYAIQPGRGKKGIGSFLCTTLKRERLQEISEADARQEGPPTKDCFRVLWDSIHGKGKRWADNPPVWIIGMGEFEWKDEG